MPESFEGRVDEIQVKIVLQSWRIQNIEGSPIEFPFHFDLPYQLR